MRHRQVVLETASAVVVGRQSSQVARQMLHSSGVRSPQGRRNGRRHRSAASGGTVVGTAAGWFPEIARRPEVVGPREMGRRLGGVGDGPDGGTTARPVMWGGEHPHS